MACLVQAIHAAGIDTGRWCGVLARLRDDLDASVVTLARHAFDTGADTTLFADPQDPQFSQQSAAFAPRNPWYLSSQDYVAGRVLAGDDLLGAAALKRTDFYRSLLQPRGLLHRLCGVVAQCDRGAYLLTAYRREERGAFDAADRAEVQSLLDHIRLSLQSQWRWQEADDLAHALLALLDRDDEPVILVTAQCEPVYRNPAAVGLLERGVGLRLDGGRVIAASPGDRRVLREAVAQASVARPCVVALAGAATSRPVVAVVRAAGPVFASSAGQCRDLVSITVRGGSGSHDPQACGLASVYRLTAAQARVGALVC